MTIFLRNRLKWLAILACPMLLGVAVSLGGGQDAFITPKPNEQFVFATWNLKFFFDHDPSDNKSNLAKEMTAPSKTEWEWRVKITAAAIAKIKPTVLALQEIENKKVCEDLAAALKANHNLDYQVGFVQGTDTATEEDVAFLYRNRNVTPKFYRIPKKGFENGNKFKVPSRHVAMEVGAKLGNEMRTLTVINLHLKAGGGSSNEAQRIKQARVVNHWVKNLLAENHAIIILGDMNAGKRFDDTSAADAMGVLCGKETLDPSDDLVDLHGDLSADDRRTHVSKRELDRIVVSPNLIDDVGLVYKSIQNLRKVVVRNIPDDDPGKTFYDYPKSERDLSDHYPLVAKFRFNP